MSIVAIGDKIINTNYTMCCIHDLSAGGLRFTSHLDLPTSPKVLFEFKTKILNQIIQVPGIILRKQKKLNFYEYGVKFQLSEERQLAMLNLSNLLAIELKESLYLRSCNFCTKNQDTCLLVLKRNG